MIEYKVVPSETTRLPDLQEALTANGKQGWRLVPNSLTWSGPYIFEREAPDPPAVDWRAKMHGCTPEQCKSILPQLRDDERDVILWKKGSPFLVRPSLRKVLADALEAHMQGWEEAS